MIERISHSTLRKNDLITLRLSIINFGLLWVVSSWCCYLSCEVGDQGEQGLHGRRGKRGPAGPTGSTGPEGTKGVQGEAGPDGFTGPPGPPVSREPFQKITWLYTNTHTTFIYTCGKNLHHFDWRAHPLVPNYQWWLHLLAAFSPKAAIALACPVLEYSGLHVL